MITNCPRVPTKLFRGGFFPSGFAGYDYLSDNIPVTPPAPERTYHGMQKAFATQAGVWQPVVSLVGHSGMCKFLACAAKNTDSSERQFGIRVFFNGASVFADDRIAVSAGTQLGFTLIGNLFFSGAALVGAAGTWAPWDNGFLVYLYAETLANFDVVVARRTHWTSGLI